MQKQNEIIYKLYCLNYEIFQQLKFRKIKRLEPISKNIIKIYFENDETLELTLDNFKIVTDSNNNIIDIKSIINEDNFILL